MNYILTPERIQIDVKSGPICLCHQLENDVFSSEELHRPRNSSSSDIEKTEKNWLLANMLCYKDKSFICMIQRNAIGNGGEVATICNQFLEIFV